MGIQDKWSFSCSSRVRAGCLLGRCYRALGQFELSFAAFDSAMVLAKAGGWLLSEAVVVRERAMTGRMVGSAGPHCDETESKQRLAEVVYRMRMPEAEQQA